MIGLLFDGIVGVIGRGVASLLRPRRPVVIVAPADDRPSVATPSAAIERRAKAYAQLATARGLALPLEARVDAHGVHFRGVHRGREALFTTGILVDDPPTCPELQIWTPLAAVGAPVLLTRSSSSSSSSSCPPGIAALLDEEDIHNVGVTDRFVRVRFEPGTPAALIARAWDALEEALAALERDAISGGAGPYRG
jgi:hypothetical protein